MKKVLVVGGSHAEIPIIQNLIDRGFYVITIGNNKDGLGHRIANRTEYIDFSDHVKVNEFFCAEKMDYVIPGCNDFAMLSAAYVAEMHNVGNFDSYEVTKQLHQKDSFRGLCAQYNLSAPQARSFKNTEDALTFLEANIRENKSFIVKPIDLTGGKGISKIIKGDDYSKIIDKAINRSRVKTIVIEDFIDGQNHGFSCFIINQKIVWYFWDDEYYYLDNYSVAGTSYPGSSTPETLQKLIKDLEVISSKLQLKDGLLHVQYIDNNGTPFIVEVMRRPPGDLYLSFVENSRLLNYTELIVGFYLNEKLTKEAFKEIDEKGFTYARHCIKGYKVGRIKKIKYSPEIKPFIIKGFNVWDSSLYLEDYLTQKLSIIILKIGDADKAKEINNNLYKYIDVSYYPE